MVDTGRFARCLVLRLCLPVLVRVLLYVVVWLFGCVVCCVDVVIVSGFVSCVLTRSCVLCAAIVEWGI